MTSLATSEAATDAPIDPGRQRRLANLRPWRKGQQGSNQKQRYKELHDKLLTELGTDLSVIEGVLLDRCVKLLLRRPRTDSDAVRLTSEARRILERLRADRAARPDLDDDIAHLVRS